MKNLFRIPAALLLTMFIFGCGQSGPLYVSGNPSTIQTTTDPAAAEDEEEEADAENSENQ